MNIKLTLILLGISLAFNVTAQTDSAFKTPNYKERIEYFNQEKKLAHSVVFLGNSITEVGKWKELLPQKVVLNRGISGDVTAGVLARVDETAEIKPDQIFIMIGINDLKIGKPISYITAQQIKIVNRIKQISPKTKIIMLGTLPVNEGMLANIYKRLNNVEISIMNNALKSACKELGVSYVDLHPVLTDEDGQLQQVLSTDGLHLKPAAYVKWIEQLKLLKFL